MKILFCASSFQTGLTVLLTEHACALAKCPNIRLHLIFGEGEQEAGLIDRLNKSQIHYTIIPGFDKHRNFIKLTQIIDKISSSFQPDWVMVQTNWQFVLFDTVRLIKQKQYKLCYWIHGFRHNSRYKSIVALFIIGLMLKFRSDKVIASSHTVEKRFRLFVRKKIFFSFLGVDQDFFEKHIPETKINSQQKIIVFAGQFRKGKNQLWIVRAIKDLYEQGFSDIFGVLPGTGKEMLSIIEKIKEYGLSDRISTPGNLDHLSLKRIYDQAYLAIIPSNDETFGSCIAEPITCGVPVLSRPVGCAKDIIEDGENGFLFITEKELRQKLRFILTHDDLYNKVKNNTIKIQQEFMWENICLRYLKELS